MTQKSPPKKQVWTWRSQTFRALIYQIIAVSVVSLLVWFLARNTMQNMNARGIQSGFDFLIGPAGFDIGESLYPFDSSEPYWAAFLVGLANTLRVAIVGIILCTVLGTLLGVGLGAAIAYNIDVLVPGLEHLFGVQFLPREVYFISALPSDPRLPDIVSIALTSLVLSLLATLYPSWRASRLQPAQVLRHD